MPETKSEYIIIEFVPRTQRVKRKTKIKEIFNERQINPIEFSEKVGMAKNQVYEMLAGKRPNMLLDNAKKICNYLGTTLDETFGEGKIDYKTQMLNYLDNQINSLDKKDADFLFILIKTREFVKNMK